MKADELTDEELVRRLRQMAADERASLRDFIIHLRVFDERKLAAATEHATTFVYCRKVLRLGEGETYRRLQVAAVIDRLPELLDYIESGALSLTVACMLAPFLNKANLSDLAGRCRGKTRLEAESIIAAHKLTPAARDVVRWLGRRTRQPDCGPEDLLSSPGTPSPSEGFGAPPAVIPGPSAAAPAQESSEAEEARLHFSVPRSTFEKLERVRGLLRHKFPKGELSNLLDEALEALLDRIDRGRKEKPAPPKPVLPGRRRIPEWVKDAVYKRDGGRCAFETIDGKRCEAAEWLEFDHVRPFALGGASDDPDNVRLLCRAHNQHRAREAFGLSAGGQGELWTGGTFEAGA